MSLFRIGKGLFESSIRSLQAEYGPSPKRKPCARRSVRRVCAHNLEIVTERQSGSCKVYERVDQDGSGGHRHHADGEVVSQMLSLELMKTARPT
jgi:hypothetical protein